MCVRNPTVVCWVCIELVTVNPCNNVYLMDKVMPIGRGTKSHIMQKRIFLHPRGN